MLHIPILRHGKPYESVDKIQILHHATGEPVASVSMANPGLIRRDILATDSHLLENFPIADLLATSRKAADLFLNADLPWHGRPAHVPSSSGESTQSFAQYIQYLSATTGMPETLCKNNAHKIHHTLDHMPQVVAGLTRGFDLKILDHGYGNDEGRTLSYFREGRIFGAVLPSNSPGVHSLWIPALALKAPVILKPGREEPWTPLRIIAAFIAAGLPAAAFGFYPTDHAGSSELLRSVDRAMLFGDSATTKPWAKDPRIELHGPGYSKVVLDEKAADHFEKYLDVIISSILANGGRSCINASAVWTPKNARPLAEALAQRLATIKALPASDPNAQIAAFANPETPRRISASIDALLPPRGMGVPPMSSSDSSQAIDLTEKFRNSPRLVIQGRCAYLLPTIISCDRDHALANREFLFPFASVIECPTAEIPSAIGHSLVVTALATDAKFKQALMNAPNIQRLNLGPIPTWKLSWDQPHEGNLFELLYRQRAFQLEPVA